MRGRIMRLSKRVDCLLALGLLVGAGCSGGVGRDKRPYRFANGLIENEADPLAGARGGGAGTSNALPAWRRAVVARAGELLGTALQAPEATTPGRFAARVLRTDHGRVLRACAGDLQDAPQPGDVICFRAPGGARNTRGAVSWTSAGIVLTVGQEVEFAYQSGARVRRGVLNASWPHVRRLGQRIVNTYVRVKTPLDPPGARYLASELLAGFVAVHEGAQER